MPPPDAMPNQGPPDTNAVLLFARAPRAGTVKTRLARRLDPKIVLQLYRCFIQDMLATLDRVSVPLTICHTPADAADDFRRWLRRPYRLLAQRGEDLGARMKAALCDTFERGVERAVLIGSDLPDLPARIVRAAFARLGTEPAVIGPSPDGGFYLIGFRADTFQPGLFDGIDWGSEGVLRQTRSAAVARGLTPDVLPAWPDIDRFDDLLAFYRRNHGFHGVARCTLAYLETIDILNDINKISSVQGLKEQ